MELKEKCSWNPKGKEGELGARPSLAPRKSRGIKHQHRWPVVTSNFYKQGDKCVCSRARGQTERKQHRVSYLYNAAIQHEHRISHQTDNSPLKQDEQQCRTPKETNTPARNCHIAQHNLPHLPFQQLLHFFQDDQFRNHFLLMQRTGLSGRARTS